jgi:hypothetical protein
MLYAPARNSFYFFGGNSSTPHRIYARLAPFPPLFHPQAAAPLDLTGTQFVLVGSGRPTILFTHWAGHTAANRQWRTYE